MKRLSQNTYKYFASSNEPSVFCGEGYGYTTKAPGINSRGVGDYLCQHNVLLSHAEAYHSYKERFFQQQQGKVGICLNSGFHYPVLESDKVYAEEALQFELGRFAHPIFSAEGDYPQVMIDRIKGKSEAEGRPWSRLPSFTAEQKTRLKGSADFIALNYYTSRLAQRRTWDTDEISWWADSDLDGPVDPEWKRAKSLWLYSVPSGLRDLLKWITASYNNPEIMITENGWSDDGQLEDDDRVEYLKDHLSAIVEAINEGCKVSAYTTWSLTDNFEWKEGYVERFGIHYINFTSPEKERVPKKSAEFFKTFMTSKSFEF